VSNLDLLDNQKAMEECHPDVVGLAV
jgi:hypothetical protein